MTAASTRRLSVTGLLVRLVVLIPLGLWLPVSYFWGLGAQNCQENCGWMVDDWAVTVFVAVPMVLFFVGSLEFAVAVLRRVLRWWRS